MKTTVRWRHIGRGRINPSCTFWMANGIEIRTWKRKPTCKQETEEWRIMRILGIHKQVKR